MAQPIWITPEGSLGTIPEGVFFSKELAAYDPGPQQGNIVYTLIAGSVPDGIQINSNGIVSGVPTARLQGVPTDVSRDVTDKFTIRATSTYTGTTPPTVRIRDRTFTLTVTGDDTPEFITPGGSLGFFYDGDEINIQIEYTDNDPDDLVIVRKVGGELPGGVTVSAKGLISGYIAPYPDITNQPGYDITPSAADPYDFIVSAINKNYQFTLEVTDGRNFTLRTFEFFVYSRQTLTADNTTITADDSQVTADETLERAPFLLNSSPSDLGLVRGDNYYAYQFIGNDYDTSILNYAIGVNEGAGLPPGLTLDTNTGWYYGYIPDQGVTEVDYSFNIVVYQNEFIGTPITCTATDFATSEITCDSTAQIGSGQPILFTGTAFGGLTASATKVYWVLDVTSSTTFTVVDNLESTTAFEVLTDTGTMQANLIVASSPYPFAITISGAIDAEVTWLTNQNLGTINNGELSLLKIEAVNRGGRELSYRLESGSFSELPQGLELLPTGEISGRVSFNTFAIDSGRTRFDVSTSWDSTFTFTVNAYAEDTEQILYEVESVNVVNGGSGYSSITPPAIAFSTPIGASAEAAEVGVVTVVAGAVTNVAVASPGAGYTSPATASITEGFGGSGAVLTPVMRATGVKDVVSVFKTFSVRVIREFNKPYQNLVVEAMPPIADRALIDVLLQNQEIFAPEYIFRPTDPYFGKAQRVTYDHAFGLNPDILDRYVESLYENHYWKNLVLGSIETAQAVDSTGNVIYEVVYSRIVDDLVNSTGSSVGKIVNTAYPLEVDGTEIQTVYPNSLINMRNQVVDVVGQLSTTLPLWMTSKQSDGRVLGFTPAWVICYTNPGRSQQIAYYISTQFGQQLNLVDFKVDRYILDRELSANWNTVTQEWTPEPSLTTFDRFNQGGNTFLTTVDIATNLAYSDVNNRTIDYINNLGGLDGIITNFDGNTIIFAKQENYDGPPGSLYPNTNAAWQDYINLYDGSAYSPETSTTAYDQATTVPSGAILICSETDSSTNRITCNTVEEVRAGATVVFTSGVIGGIVEDRVYYIKEVFSLSSQIQISETPGGSVVALTDDSGTMNGQTENERMGIYVLTVNPITQLVTVTLSELPEPNDYVQVRRGNFYRSAELRYPTIPATGLTRISWLPLETVVAEETVFDNGSVAFIEPVDMYDPTDELDKYLVFPKTNILT